MICFALLTACIGQDFRSKIEALANEVIECRAKMDSIRSLNDTSRVVIEAMITRSDTISTALNQQRQILTTAKTAIIDEFERLNGLADLGNELAITAAAYFTLDVAEFDLQTKIIGAGSVFVVQQIFGSPFEIFEINLNPLELLNL